MSKIEKCIKCENYEPVSDGYGLCMRDAIGVMVISDYEPTKNYAYCEEDNKKAESILGNMKYGQMSYQKDTKTAYQMQKEGWCDDCCENVAKCIEQSQCEGYRRYNEDTN